MARKRKNLLPKRIAGVKVPKRVRRRGLGALAASPAGRAVLTEALLPVGVWLLMRQAERGSMARGLARRSADGLRDAGGEAAALGGHVAQAFNAASRAFIEALQQPRSPAAVGERLAAEHVDQARAGDRQPGKKHGRRPGHPTH